MKKPHLVIYWCRRDLRLTDNPALSAAVSESRENAVAFLPLFIIEDYMVRADASEQFSWANRYTLSQSLPKFAEQFPSFALMSGRAAQTLIELSEYYILSIHVNEDIYSDFYKQIKKLEKHNISIIVHNDKLTIDKTTVSGTGTLYSVFTPFKKNVWDSFMNSPVREKPDIKTIEYIDLADAPAFKNKIEITTKSLLSLFPTRRTFAVSGIDFNIDKLIEIDQDFSKNLYSESDYISVFTSYVNNRQLSSYNQNRDSLENDAAGNGATSHMSHALAWGMVSSRMIKQIICDYCDTDFLYINWNDKESLSDYDTGALCYLSELIWREFYSYVLYHNPSLIDTEFQPRFRTIVWADRTTAIERFTAWIQGRTGYPVVDAAMMQLAHTGWMHNRSRMIVASILTKNLGVDWRWGQEYFRAMLIDLDESSNNGGWQWGASVGADPKPIRIFNPYLQAENYDTSGSYQKKWLGEQRFFFPLLPIIEHKTAREQAMLRYGLGKKESDSARDY
jgi:deoxyribodipyrimidine photo-lyase